MLAESGAKYILIAGMAGAGLLGGALAAWATPALYRYLYDRAVALADTIDSLVAYVVLFVLLICAVVLTGVLAGALAAVPWIGVARLAGWPGAQIMRLALLWPLFGMLVWGALALTRTVDPLESGPQWWWLALGALLGAGVAWWARHGAAG